MPDFSHLHVHTQFSLLDGAASINGLYKKTIADQMPAIAITDHGNMFGVFQFVAEAGKFNKDNPNPVKPIVGCEFYLVDDRTKQQFSRGEKDIRYHQLFLAKNAEGYKNLVKLCSLGFIEGMYGKYPRIDKQLVLLYHKGLIATTCCLGAEVPRTILQKGEAEGEKVFKWWLDIFGEDYYIELQRHGIADQNKVNEVLLRFAIKYNVKVIASNDSHYVDVTDANAHDILLCINTGEKQSTPTQKDFGDEEIIPKGTRFAFYNDQFYFKTKAEMAKLFHDLPQAIDNTNEIVNKVDFLKLKQDILLPNFPIPAKFKLHQDDTLNQWEYLRHLTFEGASKRYANGGITAEIEERLNFELHTIKTMGFAGYFLIVADFIAKGREIGVFIGPGRGSAAGSAVAYCIGITNIDPIKYQLLFERFLNPERKSMPDIDTDFDDEGRQKVIDYVVEKYGQNQVAQIVTYGSMAARLSIKDVARVLDLPLNDANMLAKLVPEKPGISLNRVINAPLDGEKSLKSKEGLQPDEIEKVKQIREIFKGSDEKSKVLKEALVLEGSVRGTGIHAAGIIIAPDDLTDILPVCTSKETNLLITQYDGKVVEDAGVIKMDFLGLKTLTIIRDALQLIAKNHQVNIDIDTIPLDDVKTYELYQKGETTATFQFESVGMQQYLRELKPDKFEDLIAMNALYRPGPLAYIPQFIKRKHGREAVTYDLPEMEEYLKETYGITVYQEQVMLLSQKLAGFSKGDADVLRKAMGKKQLDVLNKMKAKFMEGAQANGFPAAKLEKIWTDWEAFAQYAFNKSHSTCYAFVAYQTAYLKAHYPAEYMAAVLTNNLSKIDKVTLFMEESRRMGREVLGPDVNESDFMFTVNKKGKIRFGLGAVKGVGQGAVESIVAERNKGGAFKSIFDLTSRVNLKAVNKRVLESLAASGSFDCFGNQIRAVYFTQVPNDTLTVIEKSIKFGQSAQQAQAHLHHSLFGEATEKPQLNEPVLPFVSQINNYEQLYREREVIGIFLSGHPLDEYELEMHYTTCPVGNAFDTQPNTTVVVAGLIADATKRTTASGKPFGAFELEDFSGKGKFALFGESYLKMQHLLEKGNIVFIKGSNQFRYGSDREMEFRVIEMGLLSDLLPKGIEGLVLSFKLPTLTEILVNNIEAIVRKYPGKQQLRLVIDDPEFGIIQLKANKYKVEVNRELVNQLKQLNGLQIDLLPKPLRYPKAIGTALFEEDELAFDEIVEN